MRKKFISLALALSIAATMFAGCSKVGSNDETTAPANKDRTTAASEVPDGSADDAGVESDTTEAEVTTTISQADEEREELESLNIDLLWYYTLPSEEADIDYYLHLCDNEPEMATAYVLSVTSTQEDCEFDALDYYTAYDASGNELAGWTKHFDYEVEDADGNITRLMTYRTPGEMPQDITFRVRGNHMEEDDYVEISVGLDSYGDFGRYYAEDTDINDSSKSNIVLINGVHYLYTGIDHTGSDYSSSGDERTDAYTVTIGLQALDADAFDTKLTADMFAVEVLDENVSPEGNIADRLSVYVADCVYEGTGTIYEVKELTTLVTACAGYFYTESEYDAGFDTDAAKENACNWLLNHFLVCDDGVGNVTKLYF